MCEFYLRQQLIDNMKTVQLQGIVSKAKPLELEQGIKRYPLLMNTRNPGG